MCARDFSLRSAIPALTLGRTEFGAVVLMGTFSKRIETSVAVLLGSLYTLVTIITQRMLPVLVIHAILEIPAIYTYHMKRV